MVDALQRSYQLLRPEGLLFDLRPDTVYSQVGIRSDGVTEILGEIEVTFKYDYLADGAVETVVEAGLFDHLWKSGFESERRMESFPDFEDWFARRKFLTGDLSSYQWLIDKAKIALANSVAGAYLFSTGPIKLNVYRKIDPTECSREQD